MADNDSKTTVDDDDGDKVTPLVDRLALSDEDHDKLPADQQIADRDELRAFQTSVTETATGAALKTFREEQAATEEQARLDGVTAAAIKTEVDWLDDLDKRRMDADPEVAQKAATEFGNNVERYQRAAAEKGKTSQQSVTREVLATHYREMLPGAEAANEGLTAWLIEHRDELNGNTLLGVARYADEQGHERGLAEGREHAEREDVVTKGVKGAPPPSPGLSPKKEPADMTGKTFDELIDIGMKETRRKAGGALPMALNPDDLK